MEVKFTPGPWHVRAVDIPASGHRGVMICAENAIVATITPIENGPPLDETDRANARLIAAAPTMFGKLKDTVAWLDREIEGWEQIVTKQSAVMLFKLTELRDDLAETLRKIEAD